MNRLYPFFATSKIHYEYNLYGASEEEYIIIVQ